MTTPAADCGVSGGCGACPLGRAGVCGDPMPAETRQPEEWAVAQGLVVLDPDGWQDKPWTEPVTRAEFLRRAMASTVARIPQRGTEPADQVDRDPAEPRPADAGCCGGVCGG